jgi:ribose 5-phosphate isomerase B
MRIALGSDHAGVDLKNRIRHLLIERGVHCVDLSSGMAGDEVDYPDEAAPVAAQVAAGLCDRGILVCGSGLGMAIAANKIAGIRAAAVTTEEAARLSRAHNDANVLALGARLTPADLACRIVLCFLETPFDGGRHQRRIDKLAALETHG